MQTKLGIEFNKTTGEARVPSGKDFDRVYSRVVSDIASGIATSRKKISKESDRKKYLDSVVKEILGKEKVEQKQKKAAYTFKPSLKKSSKKKDLLVSSSLTDTFGSPGVDRVLWELQTIDYVKFPNATADLLRTFLEITLKKYLQALGTLPKAKRKGGYIFLNDVLAKVKADLNKSSNHQLVQVINEIEKNKWYLDSINHNPDVFAVGERVKDAWDQAYPLIKHVFDDYKKQTSIKK